MIKEIYVHVFDEGERRVYHIHDNPEYTVVWWHRAKENFRKIEGKKMTVYSSGNVATTESEIIQTVLPFIKADYPELLK